MAVPGGDWVADTLAAAGFLAPHDEADHLRRAAAARGIAVRDLLARRLQGEPLAWITGTTQFCGLTLQVAPTVYVPRPQTELLVRRGIDRLPSTGVAVDLCTGSGAIAAALLMARPRARIVASDLASTAVDCARANGVDAHHGSLFEPLPDSLRGRVDLVIGSLPYVPTSDLAALHRDTLTFEEPLAYDGGSDGLDVARTVVATAPAWLRPTGVLILELGGDQAGRLLDALRQAGFDDVRTLVDEDGDTRGIEATLAGRP